jgi:hypothetical protein
MKNFKMVLAALLAFVLCLALTACGDKQDGNTPAQSTEGETSTTPTVTKSYVANYTSGDVSINVALSFVSDGSADLYVAYLEGSEAKGAHYQGTWSSGENSDGDDTVSFTYRHGETDVTVTDAAVVDNQFTATEIYLTDAFSSVTAAFYQTAPIALSGTSYVGYLKKTSGMGLIVYAYILNLEEDGTFSASVLQNTPFGDVAGVEKGTYVISGTEITLTYDVLDDTDSDGTADTVLAEGSNYVSKGTDYNGISLNLGLQIGQVNAKASAAPFVKITK